MEKYTVMITESAQAHLREISSYVSVYLQAPETALRLLNTLKREIESLAVFPGRIALVEEEPWRGRGVRRMPVKNYLVYFWIDEARHAVYVTAVIYGRRDQKKLLAMLD